MVKRPRSVRAPRALKTIDLVIGAALLAAAAGSALGIATYSDDRFGAFRVTWTTTEIPLTLDAISQQGGGDVEATTEVTTRNLTRALWTITITGGAARVQAVAIHVDVVAPNNDTTSKDAELPLGPTASVEVEVDVGLAQIPSDTTVSAPSLAAGREALNGTLSSTLGVGTWTIRVSLAPTAPGPLGGTEAFTIAPAATLTAYAGELSADTPEVTRG